MTRKEYYRLLKAHHICPSCKQQDAYTLAGRTYCAECAEKRRAQRHEARKNPDVRERERASGEKWRRKQKEAGICVSCGKATALEGEVRCVRCKEKARRSTIEQNRKRGILPRISGVCYRCNRGEPMDGKRVCRACYEKMLPIAKENFAKGRGGSEYWRAWNDMLFKSMKKPIPDALPRAEKMEGA